VPPLNNARHERFAQLLLQGENATDAHEQAGYVRDDGNAARLKSNPTIQERVAELQREVVKETKITVEGLIGELEDARQKATDLEQLSAAVRAIESKAKISGLLVEKRQVEISGSLDFPNCTTPEQIIGAMLDEMLRYSLNDYHDFRPEDRDHLAGLFARCMDEMDAYIEAIKERPFRTGYHAPKALPSPHRPHLNGNTRS
jgi:phage terminase small subunit